MLAVMLTFYALRFNYGVLGATTGMQKKLMFISKVAELPLELVKIIFTGTFPNFVAKIV